MNEHILSEKSSSFTGPRRRPVLLAAVALVAVCVGVAVGLAISLAAEHASSLAPLTSTSSLNTSFYTYPAPSATFPGSSNYSASVSFIRRVDGVTVNTTGSFVYFNSLANRPTAPSGLKPGQVVSWTSFALNASTFRAIVNITSSFVFTSCLVRPSALGLACTALQGNVAQIAISQTMLKLSVEFYSAAVGNSASFITLPFLLFIDPPETLVPVPLSTTPLTYPSNVWYYGPGVYNFQSQGGQRAIPCSVSMVYLAPGAYIIGGFITQCSAQSTSIVGRGILSGETYPHLSPLFVYGLLNVDVGVRNVVDGITIVDPPEFHLRSFSYMPQINNVKMPSPWFYNTDGLDGGNGGLIQNCFIRANDDSIKLQASNAVVTNIVVWQMINGGVVQFGWNSRLQLVNNAASNIVVIRSDYCNYYTGSGTTCANPSYGAIINLAPSGTSLFGINGMYLSGITVETDAMRTFFIEAPVGSSGFITNLALTNIVAPIQSLSGNTLSNTLASLSASTSISRVSFTNVSITGSCLTASSSHLVISGATGVTFTC